MSEKIGKTVNNSTAPSSRQLEALALLAGFGSTVETEEARGAAELANSDVLPRDIGERERTMKKWELFSAKMLMTTHFSFT